MVAEGTRARHKFVQFIANQPDICALPVLLAWKTGSRNSFHFGMRVTFTVHTSTYQCFAREYDRHEDCSILESTTSQATAGPTSFHFDLIVSLSFLAHMFNNHPVQSMIDNWSKLYHVQVWGFLVKTLRRAFKGPRDTSPGTLGHNVRVIIGRDSLPILVTPPHSKFIQHSHIPIPWS